jgi:acyl CoA:acetate/3-ketoacid CoA transferase alpha subunit
VAELSGLSTAVDAFHRDQRPTFLIDALVTRGARDLPAATMEQALGHVISLYAEVDTAEGWMIATTRRLKVRE